MKKPELIEAISARSGQSKTAVAAMLDALAEVTVEALKSSGSVTIPGMGKYELRERGARTVRNPKTGEAIEKPPGRTVSIKAVKSVKDAVAV